MCDGAEVVFELVGVSSGMLPIRPDGDRDALIEVYQERSGKIMGRLGVRETSFVTVKIGVTPFAGYDRYLFMFPQSGVPFECVTCDEFAKFVIILNDRLRSLWSVWMDCQGINPLEQSSLETLLESSKWNCRCGWSDDLDNRKENLRLCTHRQNIQASRKRNGNTSSKYKGVHWEKSRQKWRGKITRMDGKTIFLGYFDSELDAAKVYDDKARELFGDFAQLNFPEKAEKADRLFPEQEG